MLSKLTDFIKSLLFPVFCVECGAEGEWWCAATCLPKNLNLYIPACPVCQTPTSGGETCISCQASAPLNGLTAVFIYKEGTPVSKLIRQYKYHFARDIERVWKRVVELSGAKPNSGAVVMPVPLHPRRRRERGFNQAAQIAKLFAEQHGLEYRENLLSRTKYTSQQAKLSRPEREKIVRGAFVWAAAESAPQNVILVDDVFTTGATMSECARVLKQNGAKTVWGFALARD